MATIKCPFHGDGQVPENHGVAVKVVPVTSKHACARVLPEENDGRERAATLFVFFRFDSGEHRAANKAVVN